MALLAAVDPDLRAMSFVDFATLHCLAGAGGAWSMMRKAEE